MLVCVGAQLTSANQGLLVVGVILLSVAIVLGVIITVMVFKKGVYHSHRFSFVPVLLLLLLLLFSPLGPWLSLSLSMIGLVVTFVSLVLWVAVGFHVGLQKSKNFANIIIDYFIILYMQIHVILLGSLLEMVS